MLRLPLFKGIKLLGVAHGRRVQSRLRRFIPYTIGNQLVKMCAKNLSTPVAESNYQKHYLFEQDSHIVLN